MRRPFLSNALRQFLILWISQRRCQEPVTTKKKIKMKLGTCGVFWWFFCMKGTEQGQGHYSEFEKLGASLGPRFLRPHPIQPATFSSCAIIPQNSASVPILPQSPNVGDISPCLQKWLSWFQLGWSSTTSVVKFNSTSLLNVMSGRNKYLKIHLTLNNSSSWVFKLPYMNKWCRAH